MIFLGTLFPENMEQEIFHNSKVGISNAANSLQWSMIRGIEANSSESLIIINVLPVGTWPRKYRQLHLPDREWQYNNARCHEVGGLNIPVIKQLSRARKIRKLLRRYSDEHEVIIFTAYLPFLRACYNLQDKKTTAVITDIPEYYDIHQVSQLRKTARKIHNKFVYHYMAAVNRFVLLTEQMKKLLHVGTRPYMVMEGICDARNIPAAEQHKSSFSLLYSGRLNKRYGLGMLLDAIEKIDDPDLQLWLCGSGEMEEEIKEHSQIDSRIKYFGFLPYEDVLLLQQQASILINPRTNKGEYTKYSFPSKTMEYMAAGKPVIMYQLDGVPAEYAPYLFYIPEETSDSICQTIIKVRNMQPEIRNRIAQDAREFVVTQKNESVQMQRVLDFIKLSR